MTPEQSRYAVACAVAVSRELPNGPTAEDFRRASVGDNQDLLLAIHLILEHYENNAAQEAAIT